MNVTIDEDFHAQKHYVMGELAQIRDSLEDSIKQELDAIMQKVKESAISLCPKSSGALASSIEIDNSGTVQAGDFYGNSISAGSPDIINPITGKATSDYALLVHDGHAMPNGSFWEGVPFLTEAYLLYESEIENAIDRALKEISSNEPSAGKIAEVSD
jgi:hypothetical protein